jgi:hypothetical protein
MVTCFGCTLQVLPQDDVWNVAGDLFARTLCSVDDLDQKKSFHFVCCWNTSVSKMHWARYEDARSVRSWRPRLPVVDTLKGYSKALEYEYRVKIAALGTLKRYSILSLTLYLE